MQRQTGCDPGVVGPELRAEVEALLAVGPAGGELGPDREPAAPGPAAPLHRHERLLLLGQGEKRSRQAVEAVAEPGVDPVAHDGEAPVGAAGGIDLGGDAVDVGPVAQAADVDRWHGAHGGKSA